MPASTVLMDARVTPDFAREGEGVLSPFSIRRREGGQSFLEKVCRGCGRPVGNGPEIPDLGQDGLCIDCRLKDECTCPEGRFKIYLPDHSVKIVDLEEYEAVRKIFGDKVFITGSLDEDPRRIKGRRESPKQGMDELVRLFIKETGGGDMEDEEP